MWYGVFEPSTRRLVWSGGGHPAALLYSDTDAALIELESQNPCVGMLEWDDFEKNEMVMPEDARILLYSDGVFEIQKSDGETWTYEEFIEFVSQSDSPADNIMDRLIRHVRFLNGGGVLDDDFSIMDIRL
jgi:sigma-B regulation protein RsbU (phosphoserine phosphatase)